MSHHQFKREEKSDVATQREKQRRRDENKRKLLDAVTHAYDNATSLLDDSEAFAREYDDFHELLAEFDL